MSLLFDYPVPERPSNDNQPYQCTSNLPFQII